MQEIKQEQEIKNYEFKQETNRLKKIKRQEYNKRSPPKQTNKTINPKFGVEYHKNYNKKYYPKNSEELLRKQKKKYHENKFILKLNFPTFVVNSKEKHNFFSNYKNSAETRVCFY